MSPDTLTAHHNDTITINITSDTDAEVHLNGYDVHFETKAGQVVSQTFKADKSDDFEIEWKSTSTHLRHLVVSGCSPPPSFCTDSGSATTCLHRSLCTCS